MAKVSGARVLSIDPSPGDQGEIRAMLEAAGTGVPRRPPFDVVPVATVAGALALLKEQTFDVALVSSPTSVGDAIAGVGALREHCHSLPVVLVLDQDDERIAVEAATRGVQDCIVRDELVGNLLARSLQYAMERQELQSELERRSIVDELTGLYNRRGFFALGEQEWRRARRKKEIFLLVFIDVDGLKRINDLEGHEAGDELIKDAAALLGGAFRDTDILARIGGDEFAVIAHQTGGGGAEVIRERLKRDVDAHNGAAGRRRPLSLSVGITVYDPASEPNAGLDALLSRADRLMYEEKQRGKRARE